MQNYLERRIRRVASVAGIAIFILYEGATLYKPVIALFTELSSVSLLSRRWNSFFDNLLDVHQKLKEQGFLYYVGEVRILNDEEVSE